MRRTRSPRVGQGSASLQVVRSWCSSGKGLLGSRGDTRENLNCARYYKRLEGIAKLATTYMPFSSWLVVLDGCAPAKGPRASAHLRVGLAPSREVPTPRRSGSTK